MKQLITILLIALFTISARDHSAIVDTTKADHIEAREEWVESMFNSMTEDERIGQLFMIRAHSNLGASHIAKVCLLYTSPSPRDRQKSRMPSSA